MECIKENREEVLLVQSPSPQPRHNKREGGERKAGAYPIPLFRVVLMSRSTPPSILFRASLTSASPCTLPPGSLPLEYWDFLDIVLREPLPLPPREAEEVAPARAVASSRGDLRGDATGVRAEARLSSSPPPALPTALVVLLPPRPRSPFFLALRTSLRASFSFFSASALF